VKASLERIFENVLDWEHLPWLHERSFCGITLEEEGPWGWRACVQLPPRERPQQIGLELRLDRAARCYHARTLWGPGTGTDIRTTLTELGPRETEICVEFTVPGTPPADAERVGAAFRALYRRLWDEDEAMMQVRQDFLDGRREGVLRPGGAWPPLELGPVEQLRASLPRVVEAHGHRFRVLELQGELLAHTLVCPHRGGPLGEGRIEGHRVLCPWHGYRFDLRSGEGPPGQRCRLPVPARIEVDPATRVARLELGR